MSDQKPLSGAKISDADLELDIHNTELEAAAYKKLTEGFNTLADLPENAGAQARLYHMEASKYNECERDCRIFLAELLALRAERQKSR